jgi:hypothetical protein
MRISGAVRLCLTDEVAASNKGERADTTICMSVLWRASLADPNICMVGRNQRRNPQDL